MTPDPFHPGVTFDPQDSAAVIHKVTPEMMDGVAHRAAELADGVAHHRTATPEGGPHGSARVEGDHVEPSADAPAKDGTGSGPPGGEDGDARGAAVGRAPAAPPSAETAASRDAVGLYNAALVRILRSNVAATGALFAALVRARSVPEAVAINADHLCRQMDAMTQQGRALASLAQRVTLDAIQPFTAAKDG